MTKKITNYQRWAAVAQNPAEWDERNVLIARLIPPGSRVIDVGAGNMSLEKNLAKDCEYQPVDCVPTCEKTILADFNSGRIPLIGNTYDFAVCSGVMEYVIEPLPFLNVVASWARAVILSYAVTDFVSSPAARQENGWINHLSAADLEALFPAAGLDFRLLARWRSQLIYFLQHKAKPMDD